MNVSLKTWCIFLLVILEVQGSYALPLKCLGHLFRRPSIDRNQLSLASYRNRVDSGPVLQQCSNSCRYEALQSHIQSTYKVELNPDYVNLARMRLNAKFLLEAAQQGKTEGMISNGEWVDTAEPNVHFENVYSVDDAYWHLRNLRAFSPKDKFVYTRTFKDELQHWYANVALESRPYWEPTVPEILNIKIGMILEQLRRHISLKSDPKTAIAEAQSQIDAIYERVYAGKIPNFDFGTFNQRFLNGDLRELRIDRTAADSSVTRGNFTPVAEIEKVLKKKIKQRQNVLLTFIKNPALLDYSTGVISVSRSLREEVDFIEANMSELGKKVHEATIDGYLLGTDGHIEWLLIKDSQGSEYYDHGFLHMHINYLKTYGFAVHYIDVP